MSTSSLIKVLPMAAIAILVISKFPTKNTGKKLNPKSKNPSKSFIRGVISESMEDERFVYLAVATGQGRDWVAVADKSLHFELGSNIQFHIARRSGAYESKALVMAFEEMCFADSYESLDELKEAAPSI